jgi:DHA2 family multidrug resistance protein
MVTTILARRSQAHQANLVANLHAGSLSYRGFISGTSQMLVQHGSSAADAARQAQGLAYGTVQRQASMMAFADAFWIFGMLCIVLLPLLLLMRRTHAGKGPVPVE